jgi:hypothetical protein
MESPEAVEEEGLNWMPRYLSPSLRADLEQVTHIVRIFGQRKLPILDSFLIKDGLICMLPRH